MTYSRFCVFLQIRKHTSDERSDGIFGFARRKKVGHHGRVPGVLGLLGPRVIVWKSFKLCHKVWSCHRFCFKSNKLVYILSFNDDDWARSSRLWLPVPLVERKTRKLEKKRKSDFSRFEIGGGMFNPVSGRQRHTSNHKMAAPAAAHYHCTQKNIKITKQTKQLRETFKENKTRCYCALTLHTKKHKNYKKQNKNDNI